MDENMVQDETMDDVVETDAEIIDTDDEEVSSINPVAVGVAAGVCAIAGFALANRDRIASWWDKKQEARYQKWCEKTGRSYVTIEDSDENSDEEN